MVQMARTCAVVDGSDQCARRARDQLVGLLQHHQDGAHLQGHQDDVLLDVCLEE
jgi:hypothetical protein